MTARHLGNRWLVLFASCIGVAWVTAASEAAEGVGAPQQASPAINRALMTFRIGASQWMSELRYREILAMLQKRKGVTDELSLFTSTTCTPLPLEEIDRRCRVLGDRMRQARALGYRAGINVIATLGHLEEDLPHALSGYTHITDIDGNVCRGAFCPNDPRFREYIRGLYRRLAATSPDHIWIDDDDRVSSHSPVLCGCYCDHCLARFEQESGVRHTRASLRALLTDGPAEQRLAARKAWLTHNRATMERLFAVIERAVHETKPGLELGMMTGDRFFEGYGFDRWATVLAGPDNSPVRWRPGGGYYQDNNTNDLLGKAHELGRQTAVLPRSVVRIQSEIENNPCQRLQKAARSTVIEAIVDMGVGCTGATFNVLAETDDPLDEYEPLIAQIQRARPFLDLTAKHLGRSTPIGVFPAWNKDLALVADEHGGDWFNGGDISPLWRGAPMLELGLPAAYSQAGAAVTLLFRQSVATMSDEEIRRVLATGVYMDAQTLDALNRRGFQDLTGIAVGRALPVDCIEELTDHPLNGRFVRRKRDSRQSFYHVSGYELRKADPKAQSLARLIDYWGQEKAAVSMAVFENRLGGRIAVGGYSPWSYLHSLSKASQMKSLVRWLSRDRLPAYVASYHKVNLWARRTADNRLAVLLLNASFDPASDLELALLTPGERISVWDMSCREQHITAAKADGPYQRFKLPSVEPWSVRLVVVEP